MWNDSEWKSVSIIGNGWYLKVINLKIRENVKFSVYCKFYVWITMDYQGSVPQFTLTEI